MKEGSFEELRQKMLESAKMGIKEAYSSEEYALIQAINAYLETNKSYNLTYERLTEWFGIYYPEIRVTNPSTLADLALAFAKEEPDYDKIMKIFGDERKSEEIHKKARSTIGRKMNDDERKAVIEFAELSKRMNTALEHLEKYIGIGSHKLLPNVTYLTDEKIAAELLSKAGSLERLATMPASTVQVLGAEKSLFKHLKFGSKPPKYGTLFKLPVVNTAPRDIRGRIARAYATKLTIALKADFYTKKFIGEKLKKSLDETVEKIKSAPPKEKKPMEQKQRPMGKQQRFRRGPKGRRQ